MKHAIGLISRVLDERPVSAPTWAHAAYLLFSEPGLAQWENGLLVLRKSFKREPLPYRDAEVQLKRGELPGHLYVRQVQLRVRAELTRSLASTLALEPAGGFDPEFYFPAPPVLLTAMPQDAAEEWRSVGHLLANAMTSHEVWLAGRQDLSSQEVAQALSEEGFTAYTIHLECKLAAFEFLAKNADDLEAEKQGVALRKWLSLFRSQRAASSPRSQGIHPENTAPFFLLKPSSPPQ